MPDVINTDHIVERLEKEMNDIAIRTPKFPNKASLRNNGDAALEYISRLKRHIYFSDKRLQKARTHRKAHQAQVKWMKEINKELNLVINQYADWVEEYQRYFKWSMLANVALAATLGVALFS